MNNGEYTHMVIGDGKRSFKDLPTIKFNIDKFVKEPICTYKTPISCWLEIKILYNLYIN